MPPKATGRWPRRRSTRLTALRDLLRQEYTLRVVNREGVQSGFWTFPEINTDATNYYIIVEALDADGKALTLPILNEENGQTETVNIWARAGARARLCGGGRRQARRRHHPGQ